LEKLAQQKSSLSMIYDAVYGKKSLISQEVSEKQMKNLPLMQDPLQVYMMQGTTPKTLNVPLHPRSKLSAKNQQKKQVQQVGQPEIPQLPTRPFNKPNQVSSRNLQALALQRPDLDAAYENQSDVIQNKERIINKALDAMPPDAVLHLNEKMRSTAVKNCMQFPERLVNMLPAIQPEMKDFLVEMRENAQERVEELKERAVFMQKTQILNFSPGKIETIEHFLEHLFVNELKQDPLIIGCAISFDGLPSIEKWLGTTGLLAKLTQIRKHLKNKQAFCEHQKDQKIPLNALQSYCDNLTILRKGAKFFDNVNSKEIQYQPRPSSETNKPKLIRVVLKICKISRRMYYLKILRML